LPLVLVVHENRGLNPHIEDVARRVSLENFVVLAPDALFPLGGYPGDEEQARTLSAKLEQPKAFEDFIAATQFLRAQRLMGRPSAVSRSPCRGGPESPPCPAGRYQGTGVPLKS
jgi:dienelactone hydrolase